MFSFISVGSMIIGGIMVAKWASSAGYAAGYVVVGGTVVVCLVSSLCAGIALARKENRGFAIIALLFAISPIMFFIGKAVENELATRERTFSNSASGPAAAAPGPAINLQGEVLSEPGAAYEKATEGGESR